MSDIEEKVQADLFGLQDLKYREFNMKIIIRVFLCPSAFQAIIKKGFQSCMNPGDGVLTAGVINIRA